MSTVVKVENLSKYYRLGTIGGRTLREDVDKMVAKLRGQDHRPLDQRNNETEDLWALRDISFEVGEGEVLGIIGHNGAGKSTLLKILSRITAPTSGQVKLRGRVGSLLEVGTGFHPELTGRENIFLNGAILGMSRQEVADKLDEIVEFAEMQVFIDTPVKRYSSGMAVRLAFSVAAHLEPEILIVDEVLAVGDAEFQKKCLGKMKDISSTGRTVLFVSHNLASVNSLCTRCILLDGGKIVFSGSPSDTVNRYMSRHSASESMTSDPSLIYQKELTENEKYAITQIQLLDDEGQGLSYATSWKPIRIRIKITSKVAINNASVDLKLSSELGENLIYTSTMPDHNVKFHLKEGEQYVECRFEKWPLNDGVWILSAGIAKPKASLLIWRDNLCQIRTVGNDVYGSGNIPISSRSMIATAHEWQVSDD